MSRILTLLFKGNNGIGSIVLTFPIGALGNKTATVLQVQQIFSSISGSTVAIQDASADFGTAITAAGAITQGNASDFTDKLFLVVVELP
jgi:hypothetical protein